MTAAVVAVMVVKQFRHFSKQNAIRGFEMFKLILLSKLFSYSCQLQCSFSNR